MECKIPYAIFVQETSDVAATATTDAALLLSKGLAQDTIDSLSLWPKILQDAQSEVKGSASEQEKNKDNWKNTYPSAVSMRDNLLETAKFAFYNNDIIMAQLQEVDEGDNYADTIEDLHVLAKITEEHPEPMATAGISAETVAEALAMAEELTALRSAINSAMYVGSEDINLRNRIYTLAARDVKEVQRFGCFVFRDDNNRKKLYGSAYLRNRNASNYRKQRAEADKL